MLTCRVTAGGAGKVVMLTCLTTLTLVETDLLQEDASMGLACRMLAQGMEFNSSASGTPGLPRPSEASQPELGRHKPAECMVELLRLVSRELHLVSLARLIPT